MSNVLLCCAYFELRASRSLGLHARMMHVVQYNTVHYEILFFWLEVRTRIRNHNVSFEKIDFNFIHLNFSFLHILAGRHQ